MMEEQDIEKYYNRYSFLRELRSNYSAILQADHIKMTADARGSYLEISISQSTVPAILSGMLAEIRSIEKWFMDRGIVVKTFIVPNKMVSSMSKYESGEYNGQA
jgi:hypothetical protein